MSRTRRLAAGIDLRSLSRVHRLPVPERARVQKRHDLALERQDKGLNGSRRADPRPIFGVPNDQMHVGVSLYPRAGKGILRDHDAVDPCRMTGHADDLELDARLQSGQERLAYVHTAQLGDIYHPTLALWGEPSGY